MQITIGLTYYKLEHKLQNYVKWLEEVEGVRVLILDYRVNNLQDVEQCQGIVFSGGEDVNPEFYGKREYLDKPEMGKVNYERDAFEKKVFEKAQQLQLPILGICRGQQLINALMGGTLYYDLNIQQPTIANHAAIQEVDAQHHVKAIDNTLLAELTATAQGEINSAHHQSVDKVAPGLITNSISADGTIEGLEWADKAGKPFLLCTQWHPERMEDRNNNPFSYKIREAFINAIKETQ
jgi:putative glutamine amidotransferase